MRMNTLACLVSCLCAAAVAGEAPVGFTTKPIVNRDGQKATIRFEVSASAETAHTGHGDVVITDGSYAKGDDCTDAEGLDAQAKLDSESDEDDTE